MSSANLTVEFPLAEAETVVGAATLVVETAVVSAGSVTVGPSVVAVWLHAVRAREARSIMLIDDRFMPSL
ncbi:hypothetical protein [Corynebacterium glaucum]|uniref:hypothetical protein n=1 Tax=Corynebacterium glaucum TaxID=187491 RepID=UPI000BAC1876|nr:hypothetical protein [Corynebacterium glaucum]